eukprot:TRINITY_DN45465_c0_g1_i2.p1 TRINITY_DN45465_c0_g1~~TRINITY_DN45465_c0_g1_i2.p1  ORF type:complete len:361 (+),score=39.90 TRINITY_DN45465_c0_g1_i2:82-1164(+)
MPRGYQRCVNNPFLEGQGPLPATLTPEQAWQCVEHNLPHLESCASNGAVQTSTGKWQRDYTVYTGLGGIALTYLRLGLHARDVRGDVEQARQCWQKALQLAKHCLQQEPSSSEVAFFCGTPGHIAICAAASALLEDTASAGAYVQQLLEWLPSACKHRDDEMLFGRAGHIYALLWVRKYVGDSAGGSIAEALRVVGESLVESGQRIAKRRYPDWPLMWHCFDDPYIGAAHGVVGNLAMLFQCYELLSPGSRKLVKDCLEKLMSIRFPSGNLPIILGEGADEHVHWCHGAPGIPALLVNAIKVLGDTSGQRRQRGVCLLPPRYLPPRGLGVPGLGALTHESATRFRFQSFCGAQSIEYAKT